MITKTEIKTVLETAIPGAQIILDGDDGVHFNAIVIAEQFVSLNRVKQQQLVYQALNELILSGKLHAIALKTYTPAQWASRTTEN